MGMIRIQQRWYKIHAPNEVFKNDTKYMQSKKILYCSHLYCWLYTEHPQS